MSDCQNGAGTSIKANNRPVSLEQVSEPQSSTKQSLTYMFEGIH